MGLLSIAIVSILPVPLLVLVVYELLAIWAGTCMQIEMMEEGTYLEDFLVTLEMIPNAIRRDGELMRDLDRETTEINKELLELEMMYLSNAASIKVKNLEWINAVAAAPIPTPSRKRGRGGSSITDTSCNEESVQRKSLDEIINRNRKIWEEIILLKERAAQRMAEKCALAQNMLNLVDQHSSRLDGELTRFASELKGGGEYDAPKGIPVDSEVAFYIDLHSAEERSLFLGKVVAYRSEINSYDILDVDDQQKYILPEHQVFGLGLADAQRKISKGDVLFALYPDSTSFYAATIVQAPKKSMIVDPTVLLQFVGDEDATGKKGVSIRLFSLL